MIRSSHCPRPPSAMRSDLPAVALEVDAGDDELGKDSHERERRETLDRIVLEPGIKADIDRVRPDRTDRQRITVRRSVGDVDGGEPAAGPWLVFHDDCLPQRLRQFVRDDAYLHISTASGRKRNNNAKPERRTMLVIRPARKRLLA